MYRDVEMYAFYAMKFEVSIIAITIRNLLTLAAMMIMALFCVQMIALGSLKSRQIYPHLNVGALVCVSTR